MSILNLKPDILYVLAFPDGHEIEFTEGGARQGFEAICDAVMGLKDGEEISIKAFAQ
jgi:phosphoserine aminotransferase